MINSKYFSAILSVCMVLCVVVGCSMDERVNLDGQSETVTVAGREFPADAFYQGMVSVKFTEDMASQLESLSSEDGKVDPASVKSFDTELSGVRITAIERTFMHGGRYEARMRKYGMHLWYNLYIEEGTSLSKAGAGIESLEGVQKVEYRRLIEIAGDSPAVYAVPEEVAQRSNAATEYFNDPLLYRQWHYFNDGSVSEQAIAGSDINVLPVWKEGVVGRPDVIVAVMDEGIYWGHEDLKDNMWNGYDEEGNVVYGYNFCDMSYKIDADEHGTHVAGTIAAVNNNGIGVGGVAGGDKGRGIDGVKVMSCQILKNGGAPDNGFTAPRFPEALAWAANHGAVISQNSWSHPLNGAVGYDVEAASELDKTAIRYFTECAGMDETGEVQDPDSPMAGGVVIFAAANDYHSQKAIPAMFDDCIAVASIDSKYELGVYSNVGKWVDVSAPGGEKLNLTDDHDSYYQDFEEDGVYSTLPPKNGVSYGYKHGTSMACPHVSGVAALIISKYGGQGFTNADLRTRLLTTVTNIDKYNPEFGGLMGMGLVNAANAVLGMEAGEKPAAVSDLKAEAFGDNVVYSFTVPSAESDAFYLLISEKKITGDDYGSSNFYRVELAEDAYGNLYEGKQSTSRFSRTLYVGVLVIGKNGVVSELSNVIEIQTGAENRTPTIEPLDDTVGSVYNDAVAVFRFLVKDEDRHNLNVSFYPNRNYVSLDYIPDNDTLRVLIDGTKAYPGDAKIFLRVEDELSAASEYEFKFTIFNEPTPDTPAVPDDPNAPGIESVLTFYPNPVTDNNLYIKGDQGKETTWVEIYTSAGTLAYQSDAYEIGGSAPVDMTGLPAGVYTVKTMYKGMEKTRTVTKL